MRRLGGLSLALLAFPLVARGALSWDTREIKLEAKATDREVMATYHFKNGGGSAIAIADIVASCDCLTTELPKRSYAPGEEGTLSVRQAVEGSAGLRENTLAVITDDAPGEPVILRLRLDVHSLVGLSPSVLSWRIGAEPGEQAARVVAATSLRIASIAITGTHPRDLVSARVETIEEGIRYRVLIRPASTARTANFAVAGTAQFADGTAQEFALYGTIGK